MPSYDPANDPSYRDPAYGGTGTGYGAPPPRPARNGLGIAALILGILAILTGFFLVGALFGIAAIILGFVGRGRAKRGEATNGGMALAGIITGIVGVLITAGVVALGAAFFNSGTGQCLRDAGSDQAKINACAQTGTGY